MTNLSDEIERLKTANAKLQQHIMSRTNQLNKVQVLIDALKQQVAMRDGVIKQLQNEKVQLTGAKKGSQLEVAIQQASAAQNEKLELIENIDKISKELENNLIKETQYSDEIMKLKIESEQKQMQLNQIQLVVSGACSDLCIQETDMVQNLQTVIQIYLDKIIFLQESNKRKEEADAMKLKADTVVQIKQNQISQSQQQKQQDETEKMIFKVDIQGKQEQIEQPQLQKQQEQNNVEQNAVQTNVDQGTKLQQSKEQEETKEVQNANAAIQNIKDNIITSQQQQNQEDKSVTQNLNVQTNCEQVEKLEQQKLEEGVNDVQNSQPIPPTNQEKMEQKQKGNAFNVSLKHVETKQKNVTDSRLQQLQQSNERLQFDVKTCQKTILELIKAKQYLINLLQQKSQNSQNIEQVDVNGDIIKNEVVDLSQVK